MLFFPENVSENNDKDCETEANQEEYRGCDQFYCLHVLRVKSESASEI